MKSFFKRSAAAIMVFAAMFLAMAFSSALADVKVEESVINEKAKVTYGDAGMTGEIDALHGEATAGAKAGYDSRTGYGLNANAAASGSLGKVSTQVTYGSDDYNVGGKVDVYAGKAGANAGAGINYNNGKVEAGVRAGAEVTALEVGGNVTGTVGGIKGSVGGTVKVGSVGLSVNGGYKDGKLSFGAGAALGIGASFNVTIDVGSVVDFFCDLF